MHTNMCGADSTKSCWGTHRLAYFRLRKMMLGPCIKPKGKLEETLSLTSNTGLMVSSHVINALRGNVEPKALSDGLGPYLVPISQRPPIAPEDQQYRGRTETT